LFLAVGVVLGHILRITILLPPLHIHMVLAQAELLGLRGQVELGAVLVVLELLLLRSFINE
jgi:hypothetical protein